MHIKITSLDGIAFEGNIDKLTVESMSGQVTILPNHRDLLTVLKPGLLKMVRGHKSDVDTDKFYIKDDMSIISIGGGFCKVEDNQIQVVTDYSIIGNTDPIAILEENKLKLKQKLDELKSPGANSQEYDLESLSIELEKIEGQIRLEVFKEM